MVSPFFSRDSVFDIMSKISLTLCSCALAAVLCCCGGRPRLKSCVSVVASVGDTTLVVSGDGGDVTFDTRDARYSNGLVQAGDSVDVSYIEGKASPRALLIRLIPARGNVICVDSVAGGELKTKGEPVSDEEREAMERFVRESKKHGH